MNYRKSLLLAATSIMTAGTKTVEIKTKQLISKISVIVRATNSSWTPTGHPAKIIKKIELVDGSFPLFSMRGIYAQALAHYGGSAQPFNYINYTDNGLAVAVCPIHFGRRLYDPELALMPEKFSNLQLKIEHDYALGGAVPDACTLEVWAELFDDKAISPIGYLQGKSHWSKTLVASTTDPIVLPTDAPIRLLMPCVSSDSEEPDINIDAFKIYEEHDAKILMEIGTLEHLQTVEAMFPQYVEFMEGRGLAATNVSLYVTPAKDIILAAQPSQDLDSYINFTWSGGQKRILMSSATSTFVGSAMGRCPHGAIPIPMGLIDEISDWWDVTRLGSCGIDLTTGGGDTSSLYELILQQLRRY